jgi:hypothetical protein
VLDYDGTLAMSRRALSDLVTTTSLSHIGGRWGRPAGGGGVDITTLK